MNIDTSFLIFRRQQKNAAVQIQLDTFWQRKVRVGYFLTGKLLVVPVLTCQKRVITFTFINVT